MKKSLLLLSMVMLGILVSVGFSGCGDAGGAAKTKSPVMLVVTSTGVAQYNSDVICDDGSFIEDEIGITATVKALDPDPTATSQYMDVIITGYEISYDRKDTGWEVPKTFTGNCNVYCELDAEVEFGVLICRVDQKWQPPLSYLWQLGYEPSTGLEVIHTKCNIVIWGRTLAGEEVVSQPASLLVDFADWALCKGDDDEE